MKPARLHMRVDDSNSSVSAGCRVRCMDTISTVHIRLHWRKPLALALTMGNGCTFKTRMWLRSSGYTASRTTTWEKHDLSNLRQCHCSIVTSVVRYHFRNM